MLYNLEQKQAESERLNERERKSYGKIICMTNEAETEKKIKYTRPPAADALEAVRRFEYSS